MAPLTEEVQKKKASQKQVLKEQQQAIRSSLNPLPLASSKSNRSNRVGATMARHSTLIQIALSLVLVSGTGCFLLYLLFRGAWSPDKDNVSILRTIFKMEVSRKNTLTLEGDPQQVVTRSYQSLEPYVAAENWIWINRFGDTVTYGKQDQRLIASCSAYSPLYLVCNLGEIP